MIAFSCPLCDERYKVRPEFAGRQAACLRCGNPIVVPNPDAPPPPPKPGVLEESDNLLPPDYGGQPAAEDELLDVLPAEDESDRADAAWGDDHRPRNAAPPQEEKIPEVLPAPAEYLEEVTDEPRRKRRGPLSIRGRNASMEVRGKDLRGMEIIIRGKCRRNEDDRGPEMLKGTFRIRLLALRGEVRSHREGVISVYIGLVRPRTAGQRGSRTVYEEYIVLFDLDQAEEVVEFERAVNALWRQVMLEIHMGNQT